MEYFSFSCIKLSDKKLPLVNLECKIRKGRFFYVTISCEITVPARDVMPTLFSIVFFLQYSIQQSLYMAAVFMSQFPQFCSSTRRRYQFCPWSPTLYYLPNKHTVLLVSYKLRNIGHIKEFSGIQGKHQNFDPSILPYKFGLIFKGMKQKKIIFFRKKNSKWPTQKKLIFQNRQFSKIFRDNFSDGSLD